MHLILLPRLSQTIPNTGCLGTEDIEVKPGDNVTAGIDDLDYAKLLLAIRGMRED